MRLRSRIFTLTALALGVLAFPLLAAADHATREHTANVQATGHSAHPATFLGATSAERHVNSDIAFWGDLAFNGNYDGFRIIDISDPDNPQEIFHERPCNGDQGDLVVWDNVLVRSWNSPAPDGRVCDGDDVKKDFEGLQIFDISDLTSPRLVETVDLACGSHTATGVPDLANDRLIVYSNVSSGCDWIDVVEVPLSKPKDAKAIGRVELVDGSLGTNNGCHDAGVILGDVNLLACASGHAANVFSIGAPRGGTLESPRFLYSIEEDGVCSVPDDPNNPQPQRPCNGRWHSAAFTWDGEVLILGWEPGGGAQPECEAGDPPVKKSAFFYDADTGAKLGQWTLPRPQSANENCTIHNYNVVPVAGRYILVSGNYQAGTWVTEFTDPANPETLGWSDPPPLPKVTTPAGEQVNELGGAWSSYWYNGAIYESEITKGLNVFRFLGGEVSGALTLPHLNPQTQEFTLD